MRQAFATWKYLGMQATMGKAGSVGGWKSFDQINNFRYLCLHCNILHIRHRIVFYMCHESIREMLFLRNFNIHIRVLMEIMGMFKQYASENFICKSGFSFFADIIRHSY